MSARRRHSQRSLTVVWLGILTLALALLAPTLSGEAAQQARTTLQSCDPGFALNERGICEPLTIPAQIQAQPDCEQGTVPDERTGACEPEPPGELQQPEPCPEGKERSQDTGACVTPPPDEPPLAQECPEGTALNQQTGECEQQAPPADPTDEPELGEPPQAPAAENTITLTTRTCPEGTDLDLLLPALEAACPVTPDVEFTLTFGGGATSTTATDASGVLAWQGIVSGPIEILETNWEAHAAIRVYCQYEGINDPTPMTLTNGVIAGTLDPDAYGVDSLTFACTWLQFESLGGNTLTVQKWRCPLGVQEDQQDLDTYGELCTQPHDDVEFTLDHAGGSFPGATENGEIAWIDVPTGGLTIQETIPPGFKDPIVHCISAPSDVMGEPEQVNAAGGLVSLDIPQDGWEIFCWVFNIPDETASSITIHTWNCPLGYDLDDPAADPPTECTDSAGDVTFTIDDGNPPAPDQTLVTSEDQGTVIFAGLDPGTHTVTEEVPPGVDASTGWCPSIGQVQSLDNPPRLVIDVAAGEHWECGWFNVPVSENDVEVFKWLCPEGTSYDEDFDWYEAHCTEAQAGVEFTLTSALGDQGHPNNNGEVLWEEVPSGPIGIQESVPEEFGEPVVFCNVDATWQAFPAPTGSISHEIPPGGGYIFTCHWFNIPGEPGSVTILKWTCPEGYDLFVEGADPRIDCTEVANGVQFQFGLALDGSEAVLQTTGDVIDGGVVFDELEPDTWKAVEVVPEGTEQVFVLECTGHIMGVLQPYPLQMGNVLEIEVAAGEHLTCDWYNVPAHDPEAGQLTLVKYICATETFVDEVDCEIYEDGATFDLLWWDGGNWQVVDTQPTDGVGMIGWLDLEPGDYWLDEHDGAWCHLASNKLAFDGTSVVVKAGEETVVEVYNCDPDWSTTTIPEKYPNTGVDPDLHVAPGVAVIGGLLALTLSRRRFAAVVAGSALVGVVRTVPIARATAPCPASTPVAGAEATCTRGHVPATLRIEAIGVDAPVEVLETVGGVMQQPSDEVHVAWYKESARLGEVGNLWIAGHLNWWNVPEAVFANLGLLREGDTVVLLDADGTAFTFTVAWVRQESNLEPPTEEVLGITDHAAVTLITCGGQWDTTISEYDERTVVRAIGSKKMS